MKIAFPMSKRPLGKQIGAIVRAALAEDFAGGVDVTACATVSARSRAQARIVAKQNGVVAGLELAVQAFRQMDSKAKIKLHAKDGQWVRAGTTVLTVSGKTRAILS